MILLRLVDDAIRLTIPLGDELHERVRDAIPGATWNGKSLTWEFPRTTRVSRSLRQFLVGKADRVRLSEGDKLLLAELANAAPPEELILSGENLILDIEFHRDYQDLAKRHQGVKTEAGKWEFDVSVANDLIKDISANNLDINISPEVKKVAGKSYTPPAGYDGTLLSLRGIPLSVLSHVQKEMKKPLRKTKRNPNPKTFLDRLEAVGIVDLFDLINHLPNRYIDRSKPHNISQMKIGEYATIIATIVSMQPYDRQKRMTRMTIKDEAGEAISLVFFNQHYLNFIYREGNKVIVHGKHTIYTSRSGRRFKQIDSPTIDHLDSVRGERPVIPIYPSSEKNKLTTWDFLSLTEELTNRISAMPIEETLPADLIARYNLISRGRAYSAVHFPASEEESDAARRRMIYEELLQLQLYIQARKAEIGDLKGIPHSQESASLVDKYVNSLPYELTGAQERAKKEILSDMSKPVPMHRLLQGDVGAGKSYVGAMTLLNSVGDGHQGAMMAPTEILAEQLYNGLQSELSHAELLSTKGKPLRVEFLGGKTTKKNKERIIDELKTGEIDIIVGTHALISDGVEFEDLGVAVIDEQHRFGTEQRTSLRKMRRDGVIPDMLVMTATPIPRTGAMVVYGDLDITILDELPPGRTPIKTAWVREAGTEVVGALSHPVWDNVRSEVEKGRQAYVVASLVEDNERLAAQSTEEALVALSGGALSDLRLGMVHGRMPRKDREEVMERFSNGEIDVLVSTTVIEVGVNVPNATVMVILDAGKFGIAQLHQIRGRVGRSTLDSHCYLVSDTHTADGVQRLEALVESTDGFYLAEKDLEIRGEGALFGQQQSGISDLRIASLAHVNALTAARTDAQKIIDSGELTQYPTLTAEVEAFFGDKDIQS